jgi:hypothetical protein
VMVLTPAAPGAGLCRDPSAMRFSSCSVLHAPNEPRKGQAGEAGQDDGILRVRMMMMLMMWGRGAGPGHDGGVMAVRGRGGHSRQGVLWCSLVNVVLNDGGLSVVRRVFLHLPALLEPADTAGGAHGVSTCTTSESSHIKPTQGTRPPPTGIDGYHHHHHHDHDDDRHAAASRRVTSRAG